MATKPTTPADIPVPPTATDSIKDAPDQVEGAPAEGLRNAKLDDAEFYSGDDKAKRSKP